MRNNNAFAMTWLVARRELRLRVKTRVFIVTTAIMLIAVIMPLIEPPLAWSANG